MTVTKYNNNNNVLYFKAARKEDFECYHYKEMINVWGNEYAN
jgi:hypothetical protein